MTSVLKYAPLFILVFLLPILTSCSTTNTKGETTNSSIETNEVAENQADPVLTLGASQMEAYLPLLESKRVALVVNQTSEIEGTHLVDALLAKKVNLVKIFAPEHGFRGKADAGELVKDGKDLATGLPLVSLYGSNKKPKPAQLEGVDVVVFDIQDVGARFYTYISTMHYVMEACAEQGKLFIVLDRPNPNGHYVDGPVLDPKFKSFVGMHPVPIVHGMTVAEYAQMINGEKWLKGGVQCDLIVIPCKNYNHQMVYNLPIKPSPNLPNNRSIYLYPSLCLFEGTTVSVGRGTQTQFQVFGHPANTTGAYQFTPIPQPGAKHPKHEGKLCIGESLLEQPMNQLRQEGFNLNYIVDFYRNLSGASFFLKNNFFDKLAGTDQLRKDILAGKTVAEIRKNWDKDLIQFRAVRQNYLIYP